MSYFQIEDNEGIIENHFDYYELAYARLDELKNEGFEFSGEVKITAVFPSIK